MIDEAKQRILAMGYDKKDVQPGTVWIKLPIAFNFQLKCFIYLAVF